jgi:hypothetical protein
MLLLTVVAVMGMVAAPSAAAQEPTGKFCNGVGGDDVFEEVGGGIATSPPACYPTLELCKAALQHQVGTTDSCQPQTSIVTDSEGKAFSTMQDCRDPDPLIGSNDPKSCRVGDHVVNG